MAEGDADGRDADDVDPRDLTALAALLAAAAGPDSKGETGPLPGEEAAVAAFRAAQPTAGARRGRDWLRPGRRGRTVTFAMALTALLGSGVAVAAGVTGHMTLPYPFHHPAPVRSSTAPPSPTATAHTPAPPHTAPHPSDGLPTADPTTTPSSPPRTSKPPAPHRGPNDHGKGASPHTTTGHNGDHKAHGEQNGHAATKPPNAGHSGTKQPDAPCRTHPTPPHSDPPPACAGHETRQKPDNPHKPDDLP